MMQSRAFWQTPQLTVFGSVSDLTAGKLVTGNDALCGGVPEIFCPPKFPPSPGTPDDLSSHDAVIIGGRG